MASPLEYKPDFGPKEAHVDILQKRLENAQAAHADAVAKGNEALIESTKAQVEEQQEAIRIFNETHQN